MEAIFDNESGTYQLHLMTHGLKYPQTSNNLPEPIENFPQPNPFKIKLCTLRPDLLILDIIQNHIPNILHDLLIVNLGRYFLLICIIL